MVALNQPNLHFLIVIALPTVTVTSTVAAIKIYVLSNLRSIQTPSYWQGYVYIDKNPPFS